MRTEDIIKSMRHCATNNCNEDCCFFGEYDNKSCPAAMVLIAADRLEGLAGQVNETPLSIKVKYFADIPKIEKFDIGDLIDLRAAKDVELKKGELTVIPLGVGMILPPGYEAWVLPRSSTPKKFGIECANSIGLIDNAYNGDGDEWGFVARAIRDTTIKKGDRICQFRIMKNQPAITFEEVEHLKPFSRGGFGSTGKR